MPDGNIGFSCKCSSLEPGTIVDDVAGFFENSKASEIFSAAGVDALKNFQFWKSYIVYILLFNSIGFIGFCIWGYKKDKLDFFKDQ